MEIRNYYGHHVSHHVHLHVGHYVISTLCEDSETLTEWKWKYNGHHVSHHHGHLHIGHHGGHHVHLHVGHHVCNHVGHHNVILMLCEDSERLLEWKSESITDALTD